MKPQADFKTAALLRRPRLKPPIYDKKRRAAKNGPHGAVCLSVSENYIRCKIEGY